MVLLLKSDYFRIEMVPCQQLHLLVAVMLKSDYFRIEIIEVIQGRYGDAMLKSDYFRIEIPFELLFLE